MEPLVCIAIGAAVVYFLVKSGKMPGLAPANPQVTGSVAPVALAHVPAITAYLLAVKAGDAKLSAADRLNIEQLAATITALPPAK